MIGNILNLRNPSVLKIIQIHLIQTKLKYADNVLQVVNKK